MITPLIYAERDRQRDSSNGKFQVDYIEGTGSECNSDIIVGKVKGVAFLGNETHYRTSPKSKSLVSIGISLREGIRV